MAVRKNSIDRRSDEEIDDGQVEFFQVIIALIGLFILGAILSAIIGVYLGIILEVAGLR